MARSACAGVGLVCRLWLQTWHGDDAHPDGAKLAGADAQIRYGFPHWEIEQGTKVRVIQDDVRVFWDGDNARIYILEGDAKGHMVVVPHAELVSTGWW